MPPPLSLSSLARTQSLNRTRGRPTSVVSKPLPDASPWFHFHYYSGEDSVAPCTNRALIVAIEYLNGETFENEQSMYLPGCHADADDMLELLINQGKYSQKDIRLLADVPGLSGSQSPTRENIVEGLKWLSDGCRPGDYRFFHYAGHGTQVEDLDGDEDDGLDEAIQPIDWATRYNRAFAGLIIDDEFRKYLVDPLPSHSILTAVFDCCHSGTMLDMEQETRPQTSRAPIARGVMTSKISNAILKLKLSRNDQGVLCPVGNILELPQLAKIKDSDEPVSPGAKRGSFPEDDYLVLEKKIIESPTKQKMYTPILANVVCWSACLDNQLAFNTTSEVTGERGVLTAAFTTGLRGAASNYNGMPGAFNTEQRDPTYAELFDYILAQERKAYEERLEYSADMARLYQDPQLWISASMGDILNHPVVISASV